MNSSINNQYKNKQEKIGITNNKCNKKNKGENINQIN